MVHLATAFAPAPIGHQKPEIASPVASKINVHGKDYGIQFSLHIIDFNCRNAVAHLRDIGACNRRVPRRLTDDQFDDNMFSIENGDGSIY